MPATPAPRSHHLRVWSPLLLVVAFSCTVLAAPSSARSLWSPLTVLNVTNPMDFGAVGNGVANDYQALVAAINALSDRGGIVYLPKGKSFMKPQKLFITKPHVKLWSPNQQAEIFGAITGPETQAISWQYTTWGGAFGLRLRSNATARGGSAPGGRYDHFLHVFNSTNFEACGVEVNGSNAVGIFLERSSSRLFIEGNAIKWTYADHIHHASATTRSWVWGNHLLNGPPSNGDDGVAAVTVGVNSTRCSDMEWFENIKMGHPVAWARGYAVVGADRINIHHNWAMNTSVAGLYICAERSYNTSGNTDIQASSNWLYQVALGKNMAAILVNGANALVNNVTLTNNVVVSDMRPYMESGTLENVVNVNMSTNFSDLPKPIPRPSDIKTKDTTILRTRDTSFVADVHRNGLYRIHVRKSSKSQRLTFEQRFEYVVRGSKQVLSALLAQLENNRTLAKAVCVVAYATAAEVDYAVVLSSIPLEVKLDSGVRGVTFEELRAGDLSGELSDLWNMLDDPFAEDKAQCRRIRSGQASSSDAANLITSLHSIMTVLFLALLLPLLA